MEILRKVEESEDFLHGNLELTIFEARKLPNMDLLSARFRQFFSIFSCRSDHPRRLSKIITSDPYVTVCIGTSKIAHTRVISNSQSPTWNENFKIPLAHPLAPIEFHVKDDDLFGAELIGTVSLPLNKVSQTISGWFPIISPNGKPPKQGCALRLEMKLLPCSTNPLYNLGIRENFHVTSSYFPLRHCGEVKLYQDAHVPDGSLPEIPLEGGHTYQHGKCWEDICHAILEAHHLVYIVGWSVYHKVRLIREPTRDLPKGGELCLGDLLRYKSQEGVRVLLIVWDDKTSHHSFLFKTQGLMQTHDEETRRFFKHSSVNCVLSPRYASNKLSIFKQQVVGTLYSHHQKCVIVDTQATGNNRKITAFLGGLDLCDGRYDTPQHRLFADLYTVFKDDYHNPTVDAEAKGPRQPWHDMHCRIDGPAAYDVLKNFEQRWKKASKWKQIGRRFRKVTHWHDDSLIRLDRISWIVKPNSFSRVEDDDNWNVQIFRSIDSGSLKGFPTNVRLAAEENLVCSKDLVIDKSIHVAYIEAIRSAQRFIYIENQYFIGSSYAWPSYKEAGAENLVPMELALKICSKIRAGERFTVYVVIPMWPEGCPTSSSVQEILFWQGETMKMMYEIIARELLSSGRPSFHPRDYLNFYCLGTRQKCDDAQTVSCFERFMIYMHAKGMIVDDKYVLLGSANINQRSLSGSRDTEIAMGAYQKKYTEGAPKGQVYGYRMALWAEHLGYLDAAFREPESLECVKTVNRIAGENWEKYLRDDFCELRGHILAYPIDVSESGRVTPMPGVETFPDFGGKVLGSRSINLPAALTT